jgi:hypothetical protein
MDDPEIAHQMHEILKKQMLRYKDRAEAAEAERAALKAANDDLVDSNEKLQEELRFLRDSSIECDNKLSVSVGSKQVGRHTFERSFNLRPHNTSSEKLQKALANNERLNCEVVRILLTK